MQLNTYTTETIQLQIIPDRRREDRRSSFDRRDRIRFTFEEDFSDRRSQGGRRKEDSNITGWYWS